MQRIPAPIAPVQLGTGLQTLYTVPPGTVSTVSNLSLTNVSVSPVTVTVYNVPTGQSPGATNELVASFSLSASQSYVPPQAIGLQLAAGSSLQALASAASAVNAMGGVYETSGS
jgi:hypothetical protein